LDRKKGIVCAVLAAVFYALNAPVSKLLLDRVSPSMMAAFLYLGCGMGMSVVEFLGRGRENREPGLTRKDLPYTLAMIVLDIAAPIALMIGISRTSAASASLLNNFEIVATSLIALLLFGERISAKLWRGIGLITLSSILLSVEDAASFQFSSGSVFVLLACCCWGLENNCTRMLSGSDPQQIVIFKGLGSGSGAMIVAVLAGEKLPQLSRIPMVLLLGFFAYGLSIYCYVYAQRFLGAAKTSAYYAVQPFIGVLLSLLIFREIPGVLFALALLLMIAGAWQVTADQSS